MQEQKAKWTFEQGGFSKALIACAPMGTGYHLHLIRFGRYTDFPLTYVFVPLDFPPPKLAAKDQELEAYRAALKEQETVLAMSEVERQKQAAEIRKLEGYRNDLSDQLNEAEERRGSQNQNSTPDHGFAEHLWHNSFFEKQGCGRRVDPSKSGQWWNGGWQRRGKSEWEGDKSSNIRSDDRGSVTLIEKGQGHWIENDVCEKPIDILANGVFLWTETKGTGHAFVSIHKEWSIDAYTYGRYGTPSSSPVGDGVLVHHRFDKAREYYQQELYRMNARAFKIMDVDESIALAIFQKKWLSSSIQPTADSFKESGRVVDKYDLTGNNCSTTSINALKMAGTKVFETTLNRSNPSMVRAVGASSVAGAIAASVVGDMTYTEDFVIPSSLERHMSQLASSSNMLVVEVTSLMKSAIPNTMGKNQIESTGSVGETLGAAGYGSGYVGNSSSGFSPGTTGGILGGSND